jgi:hypothetical protein
VFLAGSIVIGYTAAVALHELGHAVTNIAMGGTVRGITLHPFSWSYTHYGTVQNPALATWGGAVLSTIVGWIIIAIVWRVRRVAVLPIFLVGVIAGILNGVYLTVDSLTRGGGDGTTLMRRDGVPLWVLVTVGTVMGGVSIVSLLARIHLLGIRATDRALDRIVIMLGAAGPFLLAMLVYRVAFSEGEWMLWFTYVGLGLALGAAVGLGSGFLFKRQVVPVTQPGWPAALAVFSLGAAIVAAELLWLAG